MIGSPGPANMLMVGSGLKFGFRRSLPFVFGVVISKQFLICPMVLGIVNLSSISTSLYIVMKYLAVGYIVYLALKMYRIKILITSVRDRPPSFLQGLMVHPLNPKAWLMIATASASFIPNTFTPVEALLILAPTFFVIQAILHPLWCFFGSWVASKISNTVYERAFVWLIILLTFLSVLLVVFSD